ncbi:hypothetical protein ASPACDRAFT_110524 [Aspergillus aculeatus ATCC 16872]|uniref:Uncharacterized protein n=1 Tax=Aspergillus aculeatus (strain ATCC 16872 / CBS 172.66 / WB 5094) TaxID=690307 RepID=A0A1L9X9U7_ASPA1|nr:uncharacterized protein ASPACDRAFT_110524 [Aspergillus aculeatus ATCC 16872]OJK05200.1 hypothetical protein ASPACDRAFT_110524 [Aspergillus aculeatus ATCC 16872]
MHSTVSAHTSPVKDGRRILGEKTVNACLSPARHRHASSLSPVKRPFLETSSLTSPSKKLLPSPLFAGQKRTIDQVEGHREHESSVRERAPSQAPAPAPAAAVSTHVQVESATKSPVVAADEHILSDATQQPNIPDLETQQQQQQKQNEVEPQQQQQQQQLPPRPQPSELPAQTQPTSTRAVLSDPATRKRFIQEKATLLRTRLQTAMRHVRDPQFDRRLSELEAHSQKCPRLTAAVVLETSGSQTPTPKDTTRMAAAVAAAAADPKTPVPFVTTSSPSNLQQPEHNTSPDNDNNNNNNQASGLSSPPLSTGNDAASAREEEEEDDPMKTPTQKMYRHTTGTGKDASPMMQLSSPPATVSRRRTGTGMGTVLEESDVEEDGVSLPETQRRLSQKGDAVDGLLKLMGTAEQQQAEKAEARTG